MSIHLAQAYTGQRRFLQVLRNLSVIGVSLLFLYGCSNGGASTSGAPGGGGGPGGRGGRKGGGGGDVPVTVAVASQKDVPVEIQVIGNVEAYSTISVKAQVGGQLNKVNFNEGDYVKTGDLLFTIDQRPLEAALNLAIANAARDEASLGQAQANLARDMAQNTYTEANAKRYAELFAVFVQHRDAIGRVTFWGVTDGDSWLNNFPTRGRTNYPLLFDREGKPKPAFDAVLQMAKKK